MVVSQVPRTPRPAWTAVERRARDTVRSLGETANGTRIDSYLRAHVHSSASNCEGKVEGSEEERLLAVCPFYSPLESLATKRGRAEKGCGGGCMEAAEREPRPYRRAICPACISEPSLDHIG